MTDDHKAEVLKQVIFETSHDNVLQLPDSKVSILADAILTRFDVTERDEWDNARSAELIESLAGRYWSDTTIDRTFATFDWLKARAEDFRVGGVR